MKGLNFRKNWLSRYLDTDLESSILDFLGTQIQDNLKNGDKKQTDEFLTGLKNSVMESFVNEDESNAPKEYHVKLLVTGYGRELSDETGYEIPFEIEKLFHLY